jgi:hypothetical protein
MYLSLFVANDQDLLSLVYGKLVQEISYDSFQMKELSKVGSGKRKLKDVDLVTPVKKKGKIDSKIDAFVEKKTVVQETNMESLKIAAEAMKTMAYNSNKSFEKMQSNYEVKSIFIWKDEMNRIEDRIEKYCVSRGYDKWEMMDLNLNQIEELEDFILKKMLKSYLDADDQRKLALTIHRKDWTSDLKTKFAMTTLKESPSDIDDDESSESKDSRDYGTKIDPNEVIELEKNEDENEDENEIADDNETRSEKAF